MNTLNQKSIGTRITPPRQSGYVADVATPSMLRFKAPSRLSREQRALKTKLESHLRRLRHLADYARGRLNDALDILQTEMDRRALKIQRECRLYLATVKKSIADASQARDSMSGRRIVDLLRAEKKARAALDRAVARSTRFDQRLRSNLRL